MLRARALAGTELSHRLMGELLACVESAGVAEDADGAATGAARGEGATDGEA